ncbi:ABC transporter ATP-binding protein/permease [Roseomonas sp. SSH11]|uniref:ABC transporter ATP-binding protein/permease n=1 Tax=Pararoseomonas baculiformis TaxID=2820812 RepID=A0ABS4AAC6_9PROT|nr:ABC transporter ATP-binding protein/permease [Pararoseomonas baculiformis]MBP0443955.1 ABC transporter ATP-binding protein/permease [Pararoseomonas baculiformis]
MRYTSAALRDAWALSRPFWKGEQRWAARGLLTVVVLLNLALVGMNVLLTYWQRGFYNALETKDWDAFISLLILGGPTEQFGFIPGFCIIAAIYILVAVYALYLKQALQIRWRRSLTGSLANRWLDHRAYYRMAVQDRATDNPDQRISEDARLFVDSTLTLGLGLMRAVVTLLSFIFVLWGISGEITVFGVTIPGYLVWVALAYSALGTWLTHLIGRKLITLNFVQERVEADFRYALVRVRDNVEGIALHRGEAEEKAALEGRFGAVIGNWWAIMTATKQLTFFTAGFSQVATIFPFVVVAPNYFAGRIPLGGLIQTSTAFGSVQEAMSWLVNNYSEVAAWRATVQRLSGFHEAIAAAEAHSGEGPSLRPEPRDGLKASGLTVTLPDRRPLLEDAALSVAPGEAVLVTGASGSGKSTLFRALAGIWPFGQGEVSVPEGKRMLFLPQRPYLPLGSLRRNLAYPSPERSFGDAALLAALEDVGLAHLAPRLDMVESWDRVLSGGEQQRLAIARALLQRPDILFLDEATASLDPVAEERLYRLLRERLAESAVISIAHRPAVAAFHDRGLRLQDRKLVPA